MEVIVKNPTGVDFRTNHTISGISNNRRLIRFIPFYFKSIRAEIPPKCLCNRTNSFNIILCFIDNQMVYFIYSNKLQKLKFQNPILVISVIFHGKIISRFNKYNDI